MRDLRPASRVSSLVFLPPPLPSGILLELPSFLSCRDATVFAPTDAAIRALPRAVAQQLGSDVQLLRNVALLNFVTGKKRLAKLVSQRRGHQYITLAFNGTQRLKKASFKGDWSVRVYTDKGPKVTVTRGNVVMLRSVAVHGVNDVIRPKVLVTKVSVSGR
ncbi:unnamed protein product [Closterium sp. Naga37s-1]|nr:unnamed protein product [Closterium sp. Naga37s-1]